MKNWKKYLIVFCSIFLGAPIALFGLLVLLMPDLCGNDVYSVHISPGNKYKAIIFQRDCGATTGFSTQLSIIDANGDLDNEAGNVLILDGEPENIGLKVDWISDNELVVNHLINGNEHKAATEVGWFKKVSITYGHPGS